jgi:hypothetical protein
MNWIYNELDYCLLDTGRRPRIGKVMDPRRHQRYQSLGLEQVVLLRKCKLDDQHGWSTSDQMQIQVRHLSYDPQI